MTHALGRASETVCTTVEDEHILEIANSRRDDPTELVSRGTTQRSGDREKLDLRIRQAEQDKNGVITD